MRQKTEITIETRSITIIRARGRRFAAYCQSCGKTVSAFTPEQIALFLRLDIKEICCRIEAGEFHLIETGRTVALICGNSETQKFKLNR